jgi:glutathione S-transferase
MDFATTMKAPAYLAINPMGKVPALRHGDVIVTETGAICAYLADAFPAANLAPSVTNPLRGPYYRWMFFGAGPLDAAAANKSCGFEVPPEKTGFVGYGSLELVVNTLRQAVSGRKYLVGDHITTPDIYVSAQLGWLMHVGIIEKLPEFTEYVGPLLSRPAAVRAREIDDALMAQAQKA